jgi:hypothetical protein
MHFFDHAFEFFQIAFDPIERRTTAVWHGADDAKGALGVANLETATQTLWPAEKRGMLMTRLLI